MHIKYSNFQFKKEGSEEKLKSQLEHFQKIREQLIKIKDEELKATQSKVIQEMKPEQIKIGMEQYLLQVEKASQLHLEKDFQKQVKKTQNESYKQELEDQILKSVLKQSIGGVPKVRFCMEE